MHCSPGNLDYDGKPLLLVRYKPLPGCCCCCCKSFLIRPRPLQYATINPSHAVHRQAPSRQKACKLHEHRQNTSSPGIPKHHAGERKPELRCLLVRFKLPSLTAHFNAKFNQCAQDTYMLACYTQTVCPQPALWMCRTTGPLKADTDVCAACELGAVCASHSCCNDAINSSAA